MKLFFCVSRFVFVPKLTYILIQCDKYGYGNSDNEDIDEDDNYKSSIIKTKYITFIFIGDSRMDLKEIPCENVNCFRSSDARQGPESCSCENGIELSGCIKGSEFLDQLFVVSAS